MIFSLFWEGVFIRRGRLFEGGAFILKSEILGGRSFEGGIYSRRGVYSRKYGKPYLYVVHQHFKRFLHVKKHIFLGPPVSHSFLSSCQVKSCIKKLLLRNIVLADSWIGI